MASALVKTCVFTACDVSRVDTHTAGLVFVFREHTAVSTSTFVFFSVRPGRGECTGKDTAVHLYMYVARKHYLLDHPHDSWSRLFGWSA